MTQPSQFTPEQNEQADKRLKLQKALESTVRDLKTHYPKFLEQQPGAAARHKEYQQEERRLTRELNAHKAATPSVTEAMLEEADKRYFQALFADMLSRTTPVAERDGGMASVREVPWMMRHMNRKELEEG